MPEIRGGGHAQREATDASGDASANDTSAPGAPPGSVLERSRLARAGIAAWSLIGLGLVALAGGWILLRLRALLIAVGVALLAIAILEPVVGRLERRGLPRAAATVVAFLVLFAPLVIGIWALAAVAVSQFDAFLQRSPDLVAQLGRSADDGWRWLADRGVPLPAEDPATWLTQDQDRIRQWALGAATAATRVGAFIVLSIIGMVVAFYALLELPTLVGRARDTLDRITPRHAHDLVEGARVVARTTGAFVRGQLVIALLVGLLSTAGLIGLDVPFPVLVGAIAGISNLVPLLGPIVGSVPGVLLGLAEGGPWLALWVVLLFIIVQQLESHVMSPLILGATLRIRPFVVVLGMLAGAVAAGIFGMLLAVPAIASVKALWVYFVTGRDPSPGPAEA